jgi:hypothetical protein
MIHKDPSHHLRRNAEEMRAALPFNILIDEPQIRLVHRGRPLQRVLSTLAMQVASRLGAATRRKRAAAVPPLLSGRHLSSGAAAQWPKMSEDSP